MKVNLQLKRRSVKSLTFPLIKDDPEYSYFVTQTYDCYEDYEVSSSKIPGIGDIKEENDVEPYDQYIGSHVRVPIGALGRYSGASESWIAL
jgi:hypothetical protein